MTKNGDFDQKIDNDEQIFFGQILIDFWSYLFRKVK